jgi:L,D-transpeptidase YcbB
LSHGCIRVEKPEELAEWVLSKQSGWSHDRIVAAMHGTKPVSVKVESPIQVVTTYSTAVVTKNGEVHFYEDLYGEDAILEQQLDAEAQANVSGSPNSERSP